MWAPSDDGSPFPGRAVPLAVLLLFLVCLLPVPLQAANNGNGKGSGSGSGNGNGKGNGGTSGNSGKGQRPPAPPGTIGNGKGTEGRTELPLPPIGGGGTSNALVLASWLDDADTLPLGNASVGVTFGRAEALDGAETDAPVFDSAVGLGHGAQLAVTLPYYHAQYNDGFESSGRGSTYLALKLKLVDANTHAVGLAVSPLVEILSDAAVADPTLGISRTNWALPVSMQVGGDHVRAFGTAGYFSRGALFAAGALQLTASPRLTLTSALSYAYATNDSPGSDLQGLSRSRIDLSGSAAVHLGHALTASAGLGRTISTLDQNGSRLMASVGLTYSISPRKPAEP
jgi:hypothetical protein